MMSKHMTNDFVNSDIQNETPKEMLPLIVKPSARLNKENKSYADGIKSLRTYNLSVNILL